METTTSSTISLRYQTHRAWFLGCLAVTLFTTPLVTHADTEDFHILGIPFESCTNAAVEQCSSYALVANGDNSSIRRCRVGWPKLGPSPFKFIYTSCEQVIFQGSSLEPPLDAATTQGRPTGAAGLLGFWRVSKNDGRVEYCAFTVRPREVNCVLMRDIG